MTDTQWRRFEVFVQEKAGEPHRNVGAVHAPDAEIALMNARDVFARRPGCISLWMVPDEAILTRTAQELEDSPWREEPEATQPEQMYYVFQKQSARAAATFVTWVGQVRARTPMQALGQALELWGNPKPLVWWVLPASAVTRSRLEDVESMFAPAKTKLYRQSTQYHTVTKMKHVKSG